LKRRLELLRWAGERDCWIVEDDYEAEFLRGRRHLPALKSLDSGDRVVYVGTFSKALFPSLRLGYVVSPKGLSGDFRSAKRLDDLGSPVIEQSALATFIQSRQYDKHLRRSHHELDERRCVLLEALRRLIPNDIELSHSCGAMHLAVWLQRLNFAQCDKLIERAAQRGLGLYPLHPYYRVRPARPGLLLGFAGLSSGQLRSAVDIFGHCLREI
jgi:GntR family transcriptional regulator/MocR family aminotransferase